MPLASVPGTKTLAACRPGPSCLSFVFFWKGYKHTHTHTQSFWSGCFLAGGVLGGKAEQLIHCSWMPLILVP
jgi:hypothetical protein